MHLLSAFITIVSRTSLLLASLLLFPVVALILGDLALYFTRVLHLHKLYTFIVNSLFNLKVSNETINNDSNDLNDKDHKIFKIEDQEGVIEEINEKITIRNSAGRISFRRAVQRCEQVIYENSVAH